MLSEYQIKIADWYNIPLGDVKKLVPNFFDKELHWLKPDIKFNTHKKIEAEKINDKDREALYKLMNNAISGKEMENLRNRIDVKLVNNEKDYLKCASKSNYMSHKIFGNNLVAICKSKLASKLNKSAYIGMCVLELSKVLMYEFHYDYVKNKYGNDSKFLFTDTDRLMFEIKTGDVYEDFSNDKEMFDFSSHWIRSKYDDSSKLVIEKMKDETGGVAIEEFVGLKPKMYSFLVDNNEHKKAKGVNRNAVTARSHNEYKNNLFNKKCLTH